MKEYKKIMLFLVTILILSLVSFTPVYAESATVNNMNELKEAVERGDSVIIASNITVTETLNIASSYNGEIISDGKTLDLVEGVENMFSIPSDANVTFDNIIFDGKGNGRILDIDKAIVNIKNSELKNASTEKLNAIYENGLDAQRYDGGAIYVSNATLNLENTKFSDNHTKAIVPNHLAPNGGAIVSYASNISIKGGSFTNNYTGKVEGNFGTNGEGGAIKLHPGSILTINDENTTDDSTTIFDSNHLDGIAAEGGRQGGAIEASQSKVYIYGTTFKITGPFNTGGAIKFEGSDDAIIKNSNFVIVDEKGTIGIAGGAITSENSKLTIDNSKFKAGSKSRVAEAGGLIQVVGSGEFNLLNSELEGSGAAWNAGKYTANTGGAINFYNDSTVKALIENTNIKNFMVDRAGAGISLAKSSGSTAAVTLEMKNTNIINTAAYTWNNNGHGGAMFIGNGNTVTIIGGQISSQTASNNAGAIFNEGSLTITGGANISNNLAYQMVGGIYNDGYLKVDEAIIKNNFKGDFSVGDGHNLDKTEMGGINIYARKDVIITPKASIDAKDIRVFDGESKILLTGPLTNSLNVSISEKPKGDGAVGLNQKYIENQERYVGYTIASGIDGYIVTSEDAKKFLYVSKDTTQAIAPLNDHTSIGTWDYVLNPTDKTIVLGQRAKLTYHSNYDDKNASFKDTTKSKDQIYTFYGSGKGKPNVSINDETVDYLKELEEKPISRWIFDGWYNHNINKPVIDDTSNEFQNTIENNVNLYKIDFSNLSFVESNDKIKNIISPNELHVYAGWKPLEIQLVKVWNDEGALNKADSATLSLTSSYDNKVLEFVANRKNTTKTFSNLDKYLDDGSSLIEYKLEELDLGDGYSNETKISEESVSKLVYTITNTKKAPVVIEELYKVVHEFRVAEGVTLSLPETIRSWTPKDQVNKKNNEIVSPQDFENKEYRDEENKGTWKFVSWNKEREIINKADVKFVGTWKFEKDKEVKPIDPTPNIPSVKPDVKVSVPNTASNNSSVISHILIILISLFGLVSLTLNKNK